jgi:hypothetical protein
MEAREEREREQSAPMISNVDNLTYTPVNAATFGKWCKEWLAKLAWADAANKSDADSRQTGKQIFMEKGSIDLLTLEVGDEDNIEVEDDLVEGTEEEKDEYNREGKALYDKSLFKNEDIEDDDVVDFD